MQLEIDEWQGPFDPNAKASMGCIIWNSDIVYRWAGEILAFSAQLEDWILGWTAD